MSYSPSAKIPDQIGYLVMDETGAIITSEGELENNEKTAEAIYNLVTISDKIDGIVSAEEGFTKISVVFSDFCYMITMSNRKFHVAMRKFPLVKKENKGGVMQVAPPPIEPYLIDLQVPNTNSINA